MQGSKKSRKAFTLIELLVAMAIVSLLAILSMAGMGKVQDGVLKTKCSGNLRQIGLAQGAFAIDNDGIYTPMNEDSGVEWSVALAPYLVKGKRKGEETSVLRSPRVSTSEYINSWDMSYALSPALRLQEWKYRVNRVPNPGQIILAGEVVVSGWEYMRTSDGYGSWGNPAGQMPQFSGWWSGNPEGAGAPAYRQNGKTRANMLFCDGHVEALTRDQLVKNPTDGPSRWTWWE